MKTPMDVLFDTVEWEDCDTPDQLHSSDVYAEMEGLLRIGEITLRVYQLNTGDRVIDADDVAKLFGMYTESQGADDTQATGAQTFTESK